MLNHQIISNEDINITSTNQLKCDIMKNVYIEYDLKFSKFLTIDKIIYSLGGAYFGPDNILLCAKPIKKILGYLPEKIRVRLSNKKSTIESLNYSVYYPIYIKINSSAEDFNLRYSFINKNRPRGRFFYETDETLFYKLCGLEDGIYTMYFSIEIIS